jgi:hypothetical protein
MQAAISPYLQRRLPLGQGSSLRAEGAHQGGERGPLLQVDTEHLARGEAVGHEQPHQPVATCEVGDGRARAAALRARRDDEGLEHGVGLDRLAELLDAQRRRRLDHAGRERTRDLGVLGHHLRAHIGPEPGPQRRAQIGDEHVLLQAARPHRVVVQFLGRPRSWVGLQLIRRALVAH